MNILKYILPSLIAFFLTSLIFQRIIAFSINLGSLWINIKYYILLIFGVMITVLFNRFKKTHMLFSILLLVIFVILLLDYRNIIYNSFLVYLVILSILTYFSFKIFEGEKI